MERVECDLRHTTSLQSLDMASSLSSVLIVEGHGTRKGARCKAAYLMCAESKGRYQACG